VLASPVDVHPLATEAATGQSTDLSPVIVTPATLRLALRASAALPLLAGPPVELAGRRFYDAGLSESVPYRTALAQGATHILVLRSRRAPLVPRSRRAPLVPRSRRAPLAVPADPPPSRSARLLARTALRRETPALRATFLSRDTRLAADDHHLSTPLSVPASSVTSEPDVPVAVFSIRPPPGSPAVGRLATDGRLLREAFESGRAATHATFAP
jgi:predicted acylesterase/phospholipase RssA